ncbi:gliding motility-associated C-terminal domain-containing protein [Mucilaginibacter antarcticus]|uniref:gliding motility-associated C-terminal domain-containing protein n=1 Tax=Mucilaginibacter antarcticus TaxID=1855725 RepID=UPI00363BE7D5
MHQGGHFGYAYIDVDESKSSAPVTGNIYCAGQSNITLRGPEGFYKYQWFSDNSQLVGESQNLSIFPPPPDYTSYRLRVTPYPDLGCPSDFKTEIIRQADNFELVVHDQTGCPETGVDLTAAAVTAGSTPGLVYTYYTEASLRNHVRDSTRVSLSGTYYILGTAQSGCADVKTVKVVFTPPDIKTFDPAPARYPETIDLTKTYIKRDDLTYTYFTDADATIPLINYATINKSGTYYIKAKNRLGCESTTSVRVELLPPLPFVVTVPNTFTPNNDGINDRFGIKLDGFIKFNSIDVFNRNGQLIFNTHSISDLWDGNFKGQPLPTGTYYWLFNGLDTYYNKAVVKNGYVSIVR